MGSRGPNRENSQYMGQYIPLPLANGEYHVERGMASDFSLEEFSLRYC